MFLKKKTMACLLWTLASHVSIFQYYGIHAEQIERTADLILLRKLFALIFYPFFKKNKMFSSIYVILTIFICT